MPQNHLRPCEKGSMYIYEYLLYHFWLYQLPTRSPCFSGIFGRSSKEAASADVQNMMRSIKGKPSGKTAGAGSVSMSWRVPP